ncbi:hypothetical protein AVEN_269913-1 [Araneus ventricosus]|uniref:Uncharacterized protein n=1 Tax=Araneus ventricosus TaxID=182803 RepID=A0A4Y2FTY1_ARAVE|nr:hypothetical protein AVEN_269913-1 [Araneus ventricosus]
MVTLKSFNNFIFLRSNEILLYKDVGKWCGWHSVYQEASFSVPCPSNWCGNFNGYRDMGRRFVRRLSSPSHIHPTGAETIMVKGSWGGILSRGFLLRPMSIQLVRQL